MADFDAMFSEAVVIHGQALERPTPLKTKLLNGQEINSLLGSRSVTSIDGSARRMYLAAVAPPQPPPMTTTRRLASAAKLLNAPHPIAAAATLVVLRKSLRVMRFIYLPS
jgi:hypothetical protein